MPYSYCVSLLCLTVKCGKMGSNMEASFAWLPIWEPAILELSPWNMLCSLAYHWEVGAMSTCCIQGFLIDIGRVLLHEEARHKGKLPHEAATL